MHILVLGGTGPAGLALIRQALAAEHTVVILARSPQKVPEDISSNPLVTIVAGQLTDDEAVNKAVADVHAVVSALGPPVIQGITYPGNTPITHGYEVVINAMKKHNVKRLIVLGTSSIKDPSDKFSAKFLALVSGVAIFAHNAYKDVVAFGKLIREESYPDLVWTIARVPILTGDESRDYVAGYVGDGITHTTLSREAFAAFVIHELGHNEWCKKAPLVTKA